MDGTLYTGVTNDLDRRILTHKQKRGSRYTRAHAIKKLAYSETVNTRSAALKREAAIKRLRRPAKLSLIESSTSKTTR